MAIHPAIRAVVEPAYQPCSGFTSTCRGMRWDPSGGHVPRGICGADGEPSEVRLIIVTAEPGDPYVGENHQGDGTPYGRLAASIEHTRRCYVEGTDLFQRNVRLIISLVYPGLGFDEQLRRTWLTDSVLCSAGIESGKVPKECEAACARRFLLPQLALFPKAAVIALGGKARTRMEAAGVRGFFHAYSAAPPGCNYSNARPTWEAAARSAREHIGRVDCGAAPKP